MTTMEFRIMHNIRQNFFDSKGGNPLSETTVYELSSA